MGKIPIALVTPRCQSIHTLRIRQKMNMDKDEFQNQLKVIDGMSKRMTVDVIIALAVGFFLLLLLLVGASQDGPGTTPDVTILVGIDILAFAYAIFLLILTHEFRQLQKWTYDPVAYLFRICPEITWSI